MRKSRTFFLLVLIPIVFQNKTFASTVVKADLLKNDTTGVLIPTMVTGLNISRRAFSNWTEG